MPLFRCQGSKCSEDAHGRLIFDFESNRPVCPKCKKDARQFPNLIVKLETTHLVVEDPAGKIKGRHEMLRCICQPDREQMDDRFRISTVAGVVNCPACKKSDEYLKWMVENSEFGVIEEGDYEITLDPKTGHIQRTSASAEA